VTAAVDPEMLDVADGSGELHSVGWRAG
jgi:hypothetical protein